MNLQHIKYFLEACKYGNITKAASENHVSQPTITNAIKTLERELEYDLFDRVNNQLILNQRGQAFSKLALDAVTSFDNFYNMAMDLRGNQITPLQVGVPSVLSIILLQTLIPSFSEQHPYIKLLISETQTVTGTELLRNASLDFLFGIRNSSSSDCMPSDIVYQEVFETPLMVYVNTQNPLARFDAVSLDQLACQPLILMPKGSAINDILSCNSALPPFHVILNSSQYPIIRYMLLNNLGVTVLYSGMFVSDPTIRSLPLRQPIFTKIDLLWRRHAYLSAAMKAFIHFTSHIDSGFSDRAILH